MGNLREEPLDELPKNEVNINIIIQRRPALCQILIFAENIYFANTNARSFYVRIALKGLKMMTAYGSTLSRSVKERRILPI